MIMRIGRTVLLLAILALLAPILNLISTYAVMENHSSTDNGLLQNNSSPAVSQNPSTSLQEILNGQGKELGPDLISILTNYSPLVPYLILIVASLSLIGTWYFVWSKKTPKNLAATFALSWDQLSDNEVDDLAKRIFRACGYCAPSIPIPKELLARTVKSEDSLEALDLALDRLFSLGLVLLSDGKPVLHPLLAEFARLRDKDDGESILPSLAEALVNLTSKALENVQPENMIPLRKHLCIVAQKTEESNLPITGRLWNNIGSYLHVEGDHKGAKTLFERALKIDEKVFGLDHHNVARDANNLALVLQSLGELQEAKKLCERAIKIDEKTFGPDNPAVALDISNLGMILKELGELPEARKLFERAFKIFRTNFSENHPNTKIVAENLKSLDQN